MFCHSLASERATTATTGSVSLTLNTSCGTPGSMKMKSPAVFSTTCVSPSPYSWRTRPSQDVEHHLEADVDVRVGDAAGRNRRDVHRQLLRADVLPRQPDLVVDAVPVAAVVAVPDDEDAVVPFDRCFEIHGFATLIATTICTKYTNNTTNRS